MDHAAAGAYRVVASFEMPWRPPRVPWLQMPVVEAWFISVYQGFCCGNKDAAHLPQTEADPR